MEEKIVLKHSSIFIVFIVCLLIFLSITNYKLYIHLITGYSISEELVIDGFIVVLFVIFLLYHFISQKSLSTEKTRIQRLRQKFACVTGSDQTFIVEYIVKERKFIYWNEAIGKPISSFTVDEYYEHIHFSDKHIAHKLIDYMNQQNSDYYTAEYRWMFTGTNVYSWQLNEIFPLDYESKGKVSNYMCVCHRNNISHELLENIELYRKRVSSIIVANGIAFVEYDVASDTFNYLDNTGEHSDHLIPMELWISSIYPDDLPQAMDLLNGLRNHHFEQLHSEYRYKEFGQNYYNWFVIDASAYSYDTNNQILSYMILCRNNDAWHAAYDEMIELRGKAEMARIQSIFLQNINNKIRTPINAIMGFSSLLCDEDSQEQKEEYKDLVNKNSKLLIQIIENILALSELESGNFEFHRRSFKIVDYLNDFVEYQEPAIKDKEIKLVLQKHENFEVELDQVQTNRIMSALFSNAIKYTEKGSITIDYAKKDDGLYISVTDTGIGIAKENYERIFNRFEKLDTATSGTGIGLSVCKAIVLKANGKVGLESELGKGSTFWFWIPCRIS